MKQGFSYFDQCFIEMKEMFNLPYEVFFELNDAFFDIASEEIELLRTALSQKNMEQIILHSHTLKGSSVSLRHLSISKASAEIEYYAKMKGSFDYATAIYKLSESLALLRSQYVSWKPHNQPTTS